MPDPAQISGGSIWVPNRGQDPAKYLVDPGQVISVGRATPGNLRHARPYISSGSDFFVFPVGVEGFRRSGQAELGLHHYIGANYVDGMTIHYEEARIELNGTFAGTTARDTMVDCINILRSKPPNPGLILWAAGVFDREQYVLAETWDFNHPPDDRTHSIDYTISLVRIGEGGGVSDRPGTPAQPQPGASTTPRGISPRIFTASTGAQSLQQIAAIVYGNQNQWQALVGANNTNPAFNGIPSFQLPTYRFPIGSQVWY